MPDSGCEYMAKAITLLVPEHGRYYKLILPAAIMVVIALARFHAI